MNQFLPGDRVHVGTSGAVLVVESIDPPIARLSDGSHVNFNHLRSAASRSKEQRDDTLTQARELAGALAVVRRHAANLVRFTGEQEAAGRTLDMSLDTAAEALDSFIELRRRFK